MRAYAVASNVSVLLLARMEDTSSANADAVSVESESELDDDEGLPGRSDMEEIDRS